MNDIGWILFEWRRDSQIGLGLQVSNMNGNMNDMYHGRTQYVVVEKSIVKIIRKNTKNILNVWLMT